MKKTLCGLVAAAVTVIGLTAYNEKTLKDNEVTIYGNPISATYAPRTSESFGLFEGIFEVDGKPLSTYRFDISSNFISSNLSNAEAFKVVQSEINDGDNESVILTGNYRGNQFRLSSLEANGYKVDF